MGQQYSKPSTTVCAPKTLKFSSSRICIKLSARLKPFYTSHIKYKNPTLFFLLPSHWSIFQRVQVSWNTHQPFEKKTKQRCLSEKLAKIFPPLAMKYCVVRLLQIRTSGAMGASKQNHTDVYCMTTYITIPDALARLSSLHWLQISLAIVPASLGPPLVQHVSFPDPTTHNTYSSSYSCKVCCRETYSYPLFMPLILPAWQPPVHLQQL